MIDAQTPIAELKALLAERFTLPCSECSGEGSYSNHMNPDLTAILWARCPDCGGSGVQHSLRVACPGTSWGPYPNDVHHIQDRCLCGGSGGNVWNPDPDALADAIADKGWTYRIQSHLRLGDVVKIYSENGNAIGQTTVKEGVRDRHALLLAAARAVEAVNQ